MSFGSPLRLQDTTPGATDSDAGSAGSTFVCGKPTSGSPSAGGAPGAIQADAVKGFIKTIWPTR